MKVINLTFSLLFFLAYVSAIWVVVLAVSQKDLSVFVTICERVN